MPLSLRYKAGLRSNLSWNLQWEKSKSSQEPEFQPKLDREEGFFV